MMSIIRKLTVIPAFFAKSKPWSAHLAMYRRGRSSALCEVLNIFRSRKAYRCRKSLEQLAQHEVNLRATSSVRLICISISKDASSSKNQNDCGEQKSHENDSSDCNVRKKSEKNGQEKAEGSVIKTAVSSTCKFVAKPGGSQKNLEEKPTSSVEKKPQIRFVTQFTESELRSKGKSRIAYDDWDLLPTAKKPCSAICRARIRNIQSSTLDAKNKQMEIFDNAMKSSGYNGNNTILLDKAKGQHSSDYNETEKPMNPITAICNEVKFVTSPNIDDFKSEDSGECQEAHESNDGNKSKSKTDTISKASKSIVASSNSVSKPPFSKEPYKPIPSASFESIVKEKSSGSHLGLTTKNEVTNSLASADRDNLLSTITPAPTAIDTSTKSKSLTAVMCQFSVPSDCGIMDSLDDVLRDGSKFRAINGNATSKTSAYLKCEKETPPSSAISDQSKSSSPQKCSNSAKDAEPKTTSSDEKKCEKPKFNAVAAPEMSKYPISSKCSKTPTTKKDSSKCEDPKFKAIPGSSKECSKSDGQSKETTQKSEPSECSTPPKSDLGNSKLEKQLSSDSSESSKSDKPECVESKSSASSESEVQKSQSPTSCEKPISLDNQEPLDTKCGKSNSEKPPVSTKCNQNRSSDEVNCKVPKFQAKASKSCDEKKTEDTSKSCELPSKPKSSPSESCSETKPVTQVDNNGTKTSTEGTKETLSSQSSSTCDKAKPPTSTSAKSDDCKDSKSRTSPPPTPDCEKSPVENNLKCSPSSPLPTIKCAEPKSSKQNSMKGDEKKSSTCAKSDGHKLSSSPSIGSETQKPSDSVVTCNKLNSTPALKGKGKLCLVGSKSSASLGSLKVEKSHPSASPLAKNINIKPKSTDSIKHNGTKSSTPSKSGGPNCPPAAKQDETKSAPSSPPAFKCDNSKPQAPVKADEPCSTPTTCKETPPPQPSKCDQPKQEPPSKCDKPKSSKPTNGDKPKTPTEKSPSSVKEQKCSPAKKLNKSKPPLSIKCQKAKPQAPAAACDKNGDKAKPPPPSKCDKSKSPSPVKSEEPRSSPSTCNRAKPSSSVKADESKAPSSTGGNKSPPSAQLNDKSKCPSPVKCDEPTSSPPSTSGKPNSPTRVEPDESKSPCSLKPGKPEKPKCPPPVETNTAQLCTENKSSNAVKTDESKSKEKSQKTKRPPSISCKKPKPPSPLKGSKPSPPSKCDKSKSSKGKTSAKSKSLSAAIIATSKEPKTQEPSKTTTAPTCAKSKSADSPTTPKNPPEATNCDKPKSPEPVSCDKPKAPVSSNPKTPKSPDDTKCPTSKKPAPIKCDSPKSPADEKSDKSNSSSTTKCNKPEPPAPVISKKPEPSMKSTCNKAKSSKDTTVEKPVSPSTEKCDNSKSKEKSPAPASTPPPSKCDQPEKKTPVQKDPCLKPKGTKEQKEQKAPCENVDSKQQKASSKQSCDATKIAAVAKGSGGGSGGGGSICGDKSTSKKSQSRGCQPPTNKSKMYRNISLATMLLVVAFCSYTFLNMEHKERPEFRAYDHLRRRNKRFPWGEGNKSFFHNPHVNALPDGYEEDSDEIE